MPAPQVTHLPKTTQAPLNTSPPLPASFNSGPSRMPANKTNSASASLPPSSAEEFWKKEVKDSLRRQGGEFIKDIDLEVLTSFTWPHHGVHLPVTSIKVKVTNRQDEKSSFNLLIHAQTGKILQSWNRPVIDPINPRQRVGIKIDPRYHSEL